MLWNTVHSIICIFGIWANWFLFTAWPWGWDFPGPRQRAELLTLHGTHLPQACNDFLLQSKSCFFTPITWGGKYNIAWIKKCFLLAKIDLITQNTIGKGHQLFIQGLCVGLCRSPPSSWTDCLSRQPILILQPYQLYVTGTCNQRGVIYQATGNSEGVETSRHT